MVSRRQALSTVCIASLVVLSGCASIGVESTVNRDGTIEEYEIEIQTSQQVYGFLESSAQDEGYNSLEESFREQYNKDHVGEFEYNETVEDGDATIRLTMLDVDPSGSENLTVEKQDGEMTYVDETFVSEESETESNTTMGGSMDGAITVDYTLNMPGEITDSNADEVNGNTANWSFEGESQEIRATSEVPLTAFGPGFGIVPAVVGVLVVAVLLGRRLDQ